MATIRELTSSDGSRYYKITISRGSAKGQISRTFHPEPTWSAKTVQRELEKFVRNLEGQINNGELISRSERKALEAEREAEEAKIQTFEQLSERVFLPSVKLKCARSTYETYELDLKNWILPAIGNYKVNEITSAMLNGLLLDLLSKGKSQSVIKRVHAILCSIFKTAFENDMIQTNPMFKVSIPKPNKDSSSENQEKTLAFTLQELEVIFDALKNEPPMWQIFVRLLTETGIRRGEALGIQWSDINFSTGEIQINRSVNCSQEIGTYIGKPKNGKSRTVYISPELVAEIKKFKANQKISGLFMFAGQGGQVMNPKTPTQYFRRFGKKYGISDFHPHRLRHTCASLAVLNGVDIASISELLGHSSISMTLEMYTNSNPESRKQAAGIIQSVVSAVNE